MFEDIRVRHFYDNRTRLVATIATQVEVNSGLVRVAAAVCNPSDMPLKSLGRQLAVGRLVTGQFVRMTSGELRHGITSGSIVQRFANRKVEVRNRFVDRATQDFEFDADDNFRTAFVRHAR